MFDSTVVLLELTRMARREASCTCVLLVYYHSMQHCINLALLTPAPVVDSPEKLALALFPDLPCLLPSICVHIQLYTEVKQQQKKKEMGKHSSCTWMTSSGYEVDIGGRGSTSAKQTHWFISSVLYHSSGLQMLAQSKQLILTSKKLIFKLSAYIFEYCPFMWWVTSFFSFFTTHSLSCINVNTKMEDKNGGGLGIMPHTLVPIFLPCFTHLQYGKVGRAWYLSWDDIIGNGEDLQN